LSLPAVLIVVKQFLFEDGVVVGFGELGNAELEVGEAGIEEEDDFGLESGDGTEGPEIGIWGEVIGSHAAPSVGAG